MKLTVQQEHDFFHGGFIKINNVFSQIEIDEISEAFDRLLELAKTIRTTADIKGSQFVVEGSRIDRIVWCGAAEPCFLKYGEDSRLIGPVSQLLGSSKMDHLICQAHYKIPGDEVAFKWHQDCENRGYGTQDWTDINGKGSFVQSIIAVDESGPDNGPLQFVPGSCQRGYLGLDIDGKRLSQIDMTQLYTLTMKPGDVAFFGPYTVHGSAPNQSNRPRRVFISGYAYPGANRRTYPGKGSGREIVLLDSMNAA